MLELSYYFIVDVEKKMKTEEQKCAVVLDDSSLDLIKKLMKEVPSIKTLITALGGCDGVQELFTSPSVSDTGTALTACFQRLGGMSGLEKILGGTNAVRELQKALMVHGGLLGLIASTAVKQGRKNKNTAKCDSSNDSPKDKNCASFTSIIDSICEHQLRLEKQDNKS